MNSTEGKITSNIQTLNLSLLAAGDQQNTPE